MNRMMAMAVAVGVALAFGMAGQQLTVAVPGIAGIEVTGPESPEFPTLVTQIVGTERPVGLAASLPYGVVIRNGTAEAIAAIDTVWTAGDRVLLNATDALFGRSMLYIKPGQAVLAVPAGLLENARQLQIFANGTTEGHRLENFRDPGKVTVTVDAVVFESGRFAGADHYGAFAQWEAEIEAPRDLALSVLQKQGSQSGGDIASWIEGLAAVRRPPADAHARETILAARVLLAVYRSKGEAELYSRARSVVSAPAFPLHR